MKILRALKFQKCWIVIIVTLVSAYKSLAHEGERFSELDESQKIEIPNGIGTSVNIDAVNISMPGIYGTLTSKGSDTLANLMSLWSEAFQEKYPHVKFQIQATGSSTAPQALIQGTANLGPMSRELNLDEKNKFKRKYGYAPTAIKVAIDAIAIFVERNNPLEKLSLQQVDAIFSVTRFCKGKQALSKWHQVGINKFGIQRNILAFGRNSASGTYDLFKEQALCEGDYHARLNELSGSASIVRSVASSIGGIGYAALGSSNPDVKPIAIGVPNQNEQIEYIFPRAENVTNGRYPFWRYLFIVINKKPNTPLSLLERSFISFILSEDGQKIVQENGYFPVEKPTRQKQLDVIYR